MERDADRLGRPWMGEAGTYAPAPVVHGEAHKVACNLCGSMLREAGLPGRWDNLRVRQRQTQGGKEVVAPGVGALKEVHSGVPCKIL